MRLQLELKTAEPRGGKRKPIKKEEKKVKKAEAEEDEELSPSSLTEEKKVTN